MSTVDQTETPVALADVRAPHMSAWDRLVDVTNPLVPFGQPDPLAVDAFVPWCLRCQQAAAGVRDVAHIVGEERDHHQSAAAHVRLRCGGSAVWEDDGYQLPTIDVRLNGLTTHATPRAVLEINRTNADGRATVAHLTLAEARELVQVLEAAVDLATGRDDFDTPGAANTEAHR